MNRKDGTLKPPSQHGAEDNDNATTGAAGADTGADRDALRASRERSQTERSSTGSDQEPPTLTPTLTAIERQQLKMAADDSSRRPRNGRAGKRRRHQPAGSRFPFALLILLLVIAAGVAIIYTDFEHPLLDRIAAAIPTPPVTQQLPVEPQPAANPAQPQATVEPEPTSPLLPPAEPATPTNEQVMRDQVESTPVSLPQSQAETAPIADTPPPPAEQLTSFLDQLSLRDQPDLFRQLVQLYRAKLVEDESNLEATTALPQLQERALTELKAAIETKETPTAIQLTTQIDELFPELANSPLYQRLRVLPTPTKSVTDANAETFRSAPPPPPRPQIISLTMTPGVMTDSQFEPRSDGGVLLIDIDYRNFSNSPATAGEDTLILRIRAPGNPLLIAEIPVAIHGDRGTKSFTVDTLIKENTASYYQFDFVLHNRVLESRIVTRTPLGN